MFSNGLTTALFSRQIEFLESNFRFIRLKSMERQVSLLLRRFLMAQSNAMIVKTDAISISLKVLQANKSRDRFCYEFIQDILSISNN